MWILLTLCIILISVIYWYLNRNYNYWTDREVPCPSPLPWVGNVGQSLIMRKTIGEVYTDIYNSYQNFRYVGFYKLQTPSVLIRDIELVKDILIKNFSSFHDNDIFADENIDPIFGRNPFVLKGDRWKFVRGKITSAITTGKIKNMFSLMVHVAETMVEYLQTNPEATGKFGLEAKELANKYTTDVVASCAFGLDGKCFTDPKAEFREMGKKMLYPSLWTAIKFNLLELAPFVSKFIDISIATPEVTEWFVNILKETIRYREENNIVRNDYLDLMLSLKSKSGEYEFTDIDVTAQAMTFYSDGSETSAVVLGFAFYEVAKNTEVQNKLREEIDRVLLKHKGEVTYDAIQEMNYLDMVIAETLRKHPPGMALRKTCTKTFVLPPPTLDGKGPSVVVEPGMCAVIPLYAIHLDPKFYPDPEKFDPERFTEEAKNSRPKYTYLPFGDGPRMCLGYRFALVQMKAALVMVVKNFYLKVNPKTSPILEIDKTYFMKIAKGGLWLNFYKRED